MKRRGDEWSGRGRGGSAQRRLKRIVSWRPWGHAWLFREHTPLPYGRGSWGLFGAVAFDAAHGFVALLGAVLLGFLGNDQDLEVGVVLGDHGRIGPWHSGGRRSRRSRRR